MKEKESGAASELRECAEILGALIKDEQDVRKLSSEQIRRLINERRIRQAELSRQKEEWELTFDAVPDLIAIIDKDYRIKRVNRAMADKLGVSPAEAVGLTCYEHVHGTREPPPFCPHAKLLTDGRGHRVEVAEERLKGIYSVSVSPLPDPEGNVIGSVHIAHEITELKKVEEDLRESEKNYRILLENVGAAVIHFDTEFKIVMANNRVCRDWQMDLETLKGKSLRDIFPENEAERYERRFLDVAAKGKGAEFEDLIEIGGVKRWMMSRIDIVKNAEGEHTGYIEILYDISDRKAAEEQKALLEAQLRRTRKMESIGTLAGGIAHEFNNMLGIIIGNAELALLELPEGNSAHHNLQEILAAGIRAREVVKQLLDFSRKTDGALKPLHLSPVIKKSLKLVRSSIPVTIEMHQDISAEYDTVKADATRISQVLINLCANAAHAMEDDGGVLNVGLDNIMLGESDCVGHPELVPKKYLRLTVADSGSGMSPDVMARVFDPFFTTKEIGKGVGLGLSVVHGIVKEHGGDITVESEAGKGTTFSVLLPVIEAAAEQEAEPLETTPGGNERILFVDDEESILLSEKQTLTNLGYTVEIEKNPLKALETVRSRPGDFDILISDMTMPGMTGDRLAEKVREINPRIPVILCTGYSQRMCEEKAEQMGISAVIMKPALTHEMAEKIRKALDKGKKGCAPCAGGHILVVDDEEQVRNMIRTMLENVGYEVSEAPNGRVALRSHHDHPADLIITDLIMPEKEGIETIREIKRDFPEVKIIAISGGGVNKPAQYLDLAGKIGADLTLAKPFKRNELLQAVSTLLR